MTSATQDLQQQLTALHEHAAAFDRLLEEEADALAHRDHETLEQLASNKLRLSEGLDRHFNQLLAQLPGQADGNQDLQSHLPVGLHRQWQDLRTLLGRIQDRNRNNGQQLHLQSRQVDQAMAILQGAEQGAQVDTYGADGQTRPSSRGGRHVKV